MNEAVSLGPTSANWAGELVSSTRLLSDTARTRVPSSGRRTSRQRYAAEKYDVIDSVLALMDGLECRPDRYPRVGVRLPVGGFSGGWLHLAELDDLATEDVYLTEDIFDLWPIDARFGTVNCLHSVKSVNPREVRGRVARLMPRMIRHAKARISNGVAYTSADYFGICDDNTLVNITNPPDFSMKAVMTDAIADQVRMVVGWQLTAEFLWSVEIKARGSNFSVRIPTNPEGALRLLSLRDIEEGASRRRALRHWVSQHSRRVQHSSGEVSEVDVKAHLRGVTPFTWEDFEGVVRPSAHDLRRWSDGAA